MNNKPARTVSGQQSLYPAPGYYNVPREQSFPLLFQHGAIKRKARRGNMNTKIAKFQENKVSELLEARALMQTMEGRINQMELQLKQKADEELAMERQNIELVAKAQEEKQLNEAKAAQNLIEEQHAKIRLLEAKLKKTEPNLDAEKKQPSKPWYRRFF